MTITSKCMSFSANGTGGMYEDSMLRAAIGAIDQDISRIGYWAANGIKNASYSYGVHGTSVGSNISNSRINHSTPVRRENGANPSLIQPYIVVYFWRRTA